MLAAALLISGFFFLYPFVVYPVLLAALVRRKKQEAIPELSDGEWPSVALVICALNEQRVIGRKVDNSLALDYPKDKLSIVVISDGSTDRTAEIVRQYRDRGVELIERNARRGKIANLDEVLPQRREEILLLSDANVFYDAGVVRQIVRRFADASVGCVSGKVILTDTTEELDVPTGQYYSLEWALQENGSRLYSMVGADGAMYALRRRLFRPCPKDTLIEDLVIPLEVVRQGKRVVFEPGAVGWEEGVTSVQEEFRRKVRIAAGAAQALLRGNGWPQNAPARFWFIWVSHKLLRWCSPLFGLAALLLACFSLSEPVSQFTLAAVLAVSALAMLRVVTGWTHAIVTTPYYFLFGQVAIAVGLFKGLLGQQTVLWAKADR
jgi:cellulose synthase/poly-beta-1,6-N-acetylglucosamine synthase-like glycosyltransferase